MWFPIQKTSVKGYSWTKTVSVVALIAAVSFPLLLSEAIGGWTRKYTSPVSFSTSSINDMTGKVAIVTGANTGIGYYTALELARNGAEVIVAARSVNRGRAAMEKMQQELKATSAEPKLKFLQLDLASLESVEQFANEFLAMEVPLHVLVLNAGVMKSPGAEFVGQAMQYGFETTKDGFEYHIGVNHIAHAYLTKLLAERLKKSAPSRVVAVSSMAEQGAYETGFVFDQWVPANGIMPDEYEDGKAYGQSKLANLMFVAELATQWNGTGVTAYSLHPGVIITELSRYMAPVVEEQLQAKDIVQRYVSKVLNNLFYASMFDTAGGALTQLHLATAESKDLVNGAFYHPIGKVVTPTHSQGTNTTLQKQLWVETERAIELRGKYRL